MGRKTDFGRDMESRERQPCVEAGRYLTGSLGGMGINLAIFIFIFMKYLKMTPTVGITYVWVYNPHI